MAKINNRSYNTMFSMNDLLCNMLLAFIVLFVFALLMVTTDQKKEDKTPELKAEFLITVVWPSESPDDVDTYVEDPQGYIISFNRREQGLMHLDRDDLGHKNDTVTGPDGKLMFNENRESVIIRGRMTGEYIVNVHMYKKEWDKPTPVKIILQKTDPYSEVTEVVVVLNANGDESTAFRFVVDVDGTVSQINHLTKKFIGKQEE